MLRPGDILNNKYEILTIIGQGGMSKVWLAKDLNLNKQWAVKKKGGQGKSPVIPLRFSKSGREDIERQYATHFVDATRIAQLKELANSAKRKEKKAE